MGLRGVIATLPPSFLSYSGVQGTVGYPRDLPVLLVGAFPTRLLPPAGRLLVAHSASLLPLIFLNSAQHYPEAFAKKCARSAERRACAETVG